MTDQQWITDGFRVTVQRMSYLGLCNARGCDEHLAPYYVLTERGDEMKGSGHYCDKHKPAWGTLPDMPIEREFINGRLASDPTVPFSPVTRYVRERLRPEPGWHCTLCGRASVVHSVDVCLGCDEPAHRNPSGAHEQHAVREWSLCQEHRDIDPAALS